MRHYVFLLVALVVVLPAGGHTTTAPDFTLVTASGDEVNLDTLASEKPVIVFFWASWCPYCKAFMPHLQSIRYEFGDEVAVLALHFRDDNEPVAFLAGRHYDFTVIPDADETAKTYDVHATPGILLIDRGREIVFDLYEFPPPALPADLADAGHPARAAYLAPYWAAGLRKALDEALAD